MAKRAKKGHHNGIKKAPNITIRSSGYPTWYKDSNNSDKMAYNRRNKLQLIVDIQNITLEHTKRGVTQQWVYDNHIYPNYRISKATYYNYLAIPAKRELQKVTDIENLQLQLF